MSGCILEGTTSCYSDWPVALTARGLAALGQFAMADLNYQHAGQGWTSEIEWL